MLRLTRYFGISTGALSFVVWHAFLTREQFFPALQYLSSSKIAIAAGGNFSFALALVLYKCTVKVFLGQLREAEVERINDRISQAIMETCLAMTIFREEFNVEFCAMFTILTFVKVFHWLVADRVEYLETTPAHSRLQHLRIVAFMGVLLAIDAAFLQLTVGKTLQRSASVHLLFAFEYIIQASVVLSTAAKYTLAMIDAALEGRWAGKGTYVFYLELITDMLHLFVYLIFFVIVFANYGLPLHLVRDLYWTFRNFRNRVADFLRYRRVTANMDQRFPNATEEELQRADHTCIICREDMTAAGHNKKLPCGHVFHLHCLRSWLERQQNCPTCRTSVFGAPPVSAPQQQAPVPPAADAAGAAGAAAGAQPPPQQGEAAANGAQQGPRHVRYWRVRQAGAQAFPIHPADAAAAAAAAQHYQRQQAGQQPGQQQQQAGGQQQQQQQQRQAAAAAAAAAAYGAHYGQHQQQGWPGMGGWPAYAGGYGYPYAAWNMPQWYPHTSMALFAPAGYAPFQYAGQQNPDDQQAQAQQQQQVGRMLPVLPMGLPPALNAIIPPPPEGASPRQIQNHQAAAAAAAAAAASVMGGPHMMVPPTLVPAPQTRRESGGGGGPVSGARTPSAAADGGMTARSSGVSPAAAAAAANAAAAAAAAAVISAPSSAGMTVEQIRRRQVDILQAQLQALGPRGASPGSSNGGSEAALAGPSFPHPTPASRSASTGLEHTTPPHSIPPPQPLSVHSANANAAAAGPPRQADSSGGGTGTGTGTASGGHSLSAFALHAFGDGSGSEGGAPASLPTALQTLRRAESRNSEVSVTSGAPQPAAAAAMAGPNNGTAAAAADIDAQATEAESAQQREGETTEQAEIRRRRLQRFSSRNAP